MVVNLPPSNEMKRSENERPLSEMILVNLIYGFNELIQVQNSWQVLKLSAE